jgi:hypothetical protein
VTVKKRWMGGNPSDLNPLRYCIYLFIYLLHFSFIKTKTAKIFLEVEKKFLFENLDQRGTMVLHRGTF